jgi:hypothetical protein
MTAQQQQAAIALVAPYLTNAIQSAQQKYRAAVQSQDPLLHAPGVDGRFARALTPLIAQETGLSYVTNDGTQNTVPLYPGSVNTAKREWPNIPGFHMARGRSQARLQFASYHPPRSGGSLGWRRLHASLPLPPPSGTDQDNDGLPDAFENQLADAFTPYYHVSTGETDNFATFFDYVPETVDQRLGPHPLSYFRVKPLGFVYDGTGRQYGAIQINYLTLWDHDSGLQIGGLCDALVGIAGGVMGIDLANLLTVLTGHDLDDEHSAALVLAPTPSSYLYDSTAADYQAYMYYTAAHEGTFFDESAYWIPWTPFVAGQHVQYWLSLAKHSTYPFNPDYMPLMPGWVIWTYYDTLDQLYSDNIISPQVYYYLLYVGDTVFFACVVEHFGEQGGALASPRINVGEPTAGYTLNGCGFILDPNHVYPKLTETIWYISNAPNFSLSVSPPSQTVNPGQTTAYAVTVSPQNGFNGTVVLSASGPSGALTSFSPSSLTGSGTSIMTVSTTSSIPTGTSTITVSGVTGSITNSVTAQLIVGSPGPSRGIGTVTIAGYEEILTVDPCAQHSIGSCPYTVPDYGTVSITVNGYARTASYNQSSTSNSVASDLAGQFGSNNSNPVSPVNAVVSGSTLTLTSKATGTLTNFTLSATSATNNTQYFSYPSFTATPSGSRLVFPDFSLSAAPASQTVGAGSSTTYTVTASVVNLSPGSVTLTTAGTLPAGVGVTFSPSTFTIPGTSTMTVTTSAPTSATPTPPGTYTLTINGSVGATTHGAVVTLYVSAPYTGAGNGTVMITGYEEILTVDPCAQHSIGSCPYTVPDYGTVSITVNGYTRTANYNQGSTSNSVASDLAGQFGFNNSNPNSPVDATVSGSIVTLIAKIKGPTGNYSLSVSSATNNTQYFSYPSFTATASGPKLTGGQ